SVASLTLRNPRAPLGGEGRVRRTSGFHIISSRSKPPYVPRPSGWRCRSNRRNTEFEPNLGCRVAGTGRKPSCDLSVGRSLNRAVSQSGGLSIGAQQIALAANGLEVARHARVGLDLAPQAGDLDVDRPAAARH